MHNLIDLVFDELFIDNILNLPNTIQGCCRGKLLAFSLPSRDVM